MPGPSTSIVRKMRSSVPSPKVHFDEAESSEAESAEDRASLDTPMARKAALSEVLEHSPSVMSATEPETINSRRIPDWVIRASRYVVDNQNDLSTLGQRMSTIEPIHRTVLLVEAKPPSPEHSLSVHKRAKSAALSIMQATQSQLHQQAAHAFIADTNIKVLGALTVVGIWYHYEEFTRPDEEELKLVLAGDSEYRPSVGPSSPQASGSTDNTGSGQSELPSDLQKTPIATKLENLFSSQNSQCQNIVDTNADEVFDLILQRLQEISKDLWPTAAMMKKARQDEWCMTDRETKHICLT